MSPAQPSSRTRSRFKLLGIVVSVAGLLAVATGTMAVLSERDADLGTTHGVTLEGFGTDQEVPLDDFRGRPLVINYWASWCTYCIEEMPAFQAVYAEVSDDVAFLGIDVQDRHEVAATLVDETGVSYPLASDPRAEAFEGLAGGLGMPATLFVAPSGEIVGRHIGPLDADELRERIDEHFEL